MRQFLLLLLLVGLYGADGPDVAFLDAAAAAKAIVDESVEPYFSLLQDAEMAAKTGSRCPGDTLEARRAACRQRYAAAARGFSVEEQSAIRGLVERIHPTLRTTFPLLAATPWRFLKLDRSIEGGLPHTRGPCIIFSPQVAAGFVMQAAMATDARRLSLVSDLLVHEQCHVAQRLHPAVFATLFTSAWGFVRMENDPEPGPDLLARQLKNPDGVDCRWAWPLTEDGKRSFIQPLLLVASAQGVPRMPGDFQMVALTVEHVAGGWRYVPGADGRPLERPLEDVDAYVHAFAPTDNFYHPNETAAGLIPMLVTRDIAGKGPSENALLTALRAWCAAAKPAP